MLESSESFTNANLYALSAGGGPKSKASRTRPLKLHRPSILEGFPTRDLQRLRKWWTGEVIQGDSENLQARTIASIQVPSHLYLAGILCLRDGDPHRKALRTLKTAQAWREGRMSLDLRKGQWSNDVQVCTSGSDPLCCSEEEACSVPDEPARKVQSVRPEDAPSRKGDGNLGNSVKFVHSFCHIESVAIDLSWDMVCRFGFQPASSGTASHAPKLPKDFFDDWVQVADDEARHFLMWEYRLKTMDSSYGSLVTHTGLWDSAKDTAHDVLARLAIEHMTLEARGLDVATKSFARFQSSSDSTSADMLEGIYTEEVSHVAAGMKWFRYICDMESRGDPVVEFHRKVKQYFHSTLKPPFNELARSRAGMTGEYYLPLVDKK